jgi:hypothetical protein
MKRLDSVLLKVFLYAIPLHIVLLVFSHFHRVGFTENNGGHLELLNGFAGLVFALWMALSIYLSVRLILSGSFRDRVIAKITFIRERDEREAMLTGKAAKTALLTSLAFLILLFFLSCFQVSIYRLPPEKAIGGKTGVASLGLGFSFLNPDKQDRSKDTVRKKDIFTYSGLPLSGTSIILLLIIWQIVSYNCSMRRLMR